MAANGHGQFSLCTYIRTWKKYSTSIDVMNLLNKNMAIKGVAYCYYGNFEIILL